MHRSIFDKPRYHVGDNAPPKASASVVVTGLAPPATQDALAEAMAAFGPIASINWPDGQSFAFVHFAFDGEKEGYAEPHTAKALRAKAVTLGAGDAAVRCGVRPGNFSDARIVRWRRSLAKAAVGQGADAAS